MSVNFLHTLLPPSSLGHWLPNSNNKVFDTTYEYRKTETSRLNAMSVDFVPSDYLPVLEFVDTSLLSKDINENLEEVDTLKIEHTNVFKEESPESFISEDNLDIANNYEIRSGNSIGDENDNNKCVINAENCTLDVANSGEIKNENSIGHKDGDNNCVINAENCTLDVAHNSDIKKENSIGHENNNNCAINAENCTLDVVNYGEIKNEYSTGDEGDDNNCVINAENCTLDLANNSEIKKDNSIGHEDDDNNCAINAENCTLDVANKSEIKNENSTGDEDDDNNCAIKAENCTLDVANNSEIKKENSIGHEDDDNYYVIIAENCTLDVAHNSEIKKENSIGHEDDDNYYVIIAENCTLDVAHNSELKNENSFGGEDDDNNCAIKAENCTLDVANNSEIKNENSFGGEDDDNNCVMNAENCTLHVANNSEINNENSIGGEDDDNNCVINAQIRKDDGNCGDGNGSGNCAADDDIKPEYTRMINSVYLDHSYFKTSTTIEKPSSPDSHDLAESFSVKDLVCDTIDQKSDTGKSAFDKYKKDIQKNVKKRKIIDKDDGEAQKSATKKKVIDKDVDKAQKKTKVIDKDDNKKHEIITMKAVDNDWNNKVIFNLKNGYCKKTRFNGLPYTKERLKEKLLSKFSSCGELITRDGVVINKDFIMSNLDGKVTELITWRLWKALHFNFGNQLFSPRALAIFKSIQNKYKNDVQYESVFDIEYLITEQEMMDEFQRRKTYEYYVNSYQCQICYQGFKSRSLLEYHEKFHDISRGIQCPICGMTHRSVGRLQLHVVNYHEAVYKCKLCSLITYCRTSMIIHYEQHNGSGRGQTKPQT